MKTFYGKPVFGGIAVGEIRVLKKEEKNVHRSHIDDGEKELKRLEKAVDETLTQLKQLYEKALKEVGESGAAIFEVHQMMLEDQGYQESIQNMIMTQQVNAEYAVAVTADNFAGMFASMEDAYMKERAADVRDISERLIGVLLEEEKKEINADVPVIIVAQDLTPSETVQMDKSKVQSFVTRHGSTNSHTAILARTMNVPALIGLDYEDGIHGKIGIVDGFKGELIVNPTEEVLALYQKKQEEEAAKRELCSSLREKRPLHAAAGRSGFMPISVEFQTSSR